MATKTKDSTSVVGNKEKKTTSSNAPKRTTRPSTTSSVESSTTQSSEKHVPNYLKPTFSSQPRSQSFKLPRNDASNKPYLNRRRSFDKPQSLSRVPKQTPVASPSRQQKPLLRNIIPSSKSISKTYPKDGVKKKTSSSVNTKNVATTKSTNNEETTVAINVVENEPEVKEAIINEENVEEKVENVAEIIPPQVENDQVEVEQNNGQDQSLEHIESHDSEQVKEEIPIVLEEEEEEEEKQDQTKEENTTNCKEECDTKEINHSTNEEEVEVKEENEEELEKEEVEGGKCEEQNEQVESEVKEEEVEGGKCEEQNEQVESEVKEEEEEEREEEKKMDSSSKENEDESCVVQGKKESQISNDVIQETASKLSEERKNKVRQLAGAFQTVIDHQTK